MFPLFLLLFLYSFTSKAADAHLRLPAAIRDKLNAATRRIQTTCNAEHAQNNGGTDVAAMEVIVGPRPGTPVPGSGFKHNQEVKQHPAQDM